LQTVHLASLEVILTQVCPLAMLPLVMKKFQPIVYKSLVVSVLLASWSIVETTTNRREKNAPI